MFKTCCICKSNLEYDSFHNNKSSKDGKANQCKSCAKKYKSKKIFKSKLPENRKIYYHKNKEHINSLRSYNSDNYKLRYLNNKDKIKSYNKKYYDNNKCLVKIKQKEYRLNNKEVILVRNRARRELIKNFKISQRDIINLLNLFDNKCYYCGIGVKRGINLHLDHKLPLSKGGQHEINNLVPACITCNLRKGTKTSEEFLNIRGNECL